MRVIVFADFPEIRIVAENEKEARQKLIVLGEYFYRQRGDTV